MVPFWSRFKNGVLQNLTATYFRGLFAPGCNSVVNTNNVSACRRLYSYQRCWPSGLFAQNKWVTGGGCLLMMVQGHGDYSNARLLSPTSTVPMLQKFRKLGLRGMHSSVEDLKMANMQVKILPALADNYMYLIICGKTREAAIVDPVDPEAVINAVNQESVNLTKVLTTHHHWDHAGGNEKLVKLFDKPLDVYGGDERIGALNHKVTQDDRFKIGDLDVHCLFTPCHTTGHICYFVESGAGDKCVFTGDTLFQGGCGRFFEGTAEQMYAALIDKLSALPDDTKVFCGHEYTLQNMSYARHVEPQNDRILKRIEWAKLRRATLSPTVPSTIADEKSWNPFMRVHIAGVQKHAHESDPIRTMGSLRKEKDNFKA